MSGNWIANRDGLYKNQAGNDGLFIRFKGKCILVAIQKAL
jgi:hypothetical protein